MHRENAGCLVIIERHGDYIKPIGILTDRDIVNQIIIEELDPTAITLSDINSGELVIARESDDINTTLERMSEKELRYVPVINNEGLLTGIFAIEEILKGLSEHTNLLSFLDGPGKNAGQNLSVA